MLAVQHSALAPNDGVVIQARMFTHADLSPDNTLGTERAASRDAGLCGDNCVRADFDVVRDLNQIVQFHAAPDDRRF